MVKVLPEPVPPAGFDRTGHLPALHQLGNGAGLIASREERLVQTEGTIRKGKQHGVFARVQVHRFYADNGELTPGTQLNLSANCLPNGKTLFKM
jgi:hypothetical protein